MKKIIILLTVVTSLSFAGRYNPAKHKRVTKKQLIGFVKEAIAFTKIYGKKAALNEFKNKGGLFDRGELYIYAYDMRGKVLSHGQNAALIGRNLLRLKDPSGKHIIKEQIRIIKKNGKGWLYYYWFHPKSRRITRKLGYFEKVNKDWWLGSGLYIKH